MGPCPSPSVRPMQGATIGRASATAQRGSVSSRSHRMQAPVIELHRKQHNRIASEGVIVVLPARPPGCTQSRLTLATPLNLPAISAEKTMMINPGTRSQNPLGSAKRIHQSLCVLSACAVGRAGGKGRRGSANARGGSCGKTSARQRGGSTHGQSLPSCSDGP